MQNMFTALYKIYPLFSSNLCELFQVSEFTDCLHTLKKFHSCHLAENTDFIRNCKMTACKMGFLNIYPSKTTRLHRIFRPGHKERLTQNINNKFLVKCVQGKKKYAVLPECAILQRLLASRSFVIYEKVRNVMPNITVII